MKTHNPRLSIFFAILSIALSQIMCNFPQNIPDEELSWFDDDLSEITSDVFDVQTSVLENDCPDYIHVPEMGLVESFKFEGDKLFVTDTNDTYEYSKSDYFGSERTFCRVQANNKYTEICIEFRSKDGYRMIVYDVTPAVFENEDPKACYSSDRFITSVDELLLSENTIDGEQPEEIEQIEEQPADAEQDALEFDIASCLPKAMDYSLEIINFSDDKIPDGKHSCNADGNLINNSDQKLMFSIYRVNNYGANETRYPEGKWMGSGYQIIAPGETIEYGGFHRCTDGSCGEGEWFYIQRISIMYYTPECSQYTFNREEKVPASIVNIENPCDW